MINITDNIFDCPYCSVKKISFDKETRGIGDSDYVRHMLVRCRGCHMIIYFKYREKSGVIVNDIEVNFQYPASVEELPEYVPTIIRKFFKEAVDAFAFGLFNSASAMCRRTIYEICDYKKVEGKDYRDKIQNLGLDKRITDPLINIKNIGDDSMHSEAWNVTTIQKAMEALRIIIELLFIAEERIKLFSHHYSKENQKRIQANKLK